VLEVALACAALPANECEPAAHQVANVFPDTVARSERVLMRQQNLDEPLIGCGGFGNPHAERLEFAQRAADGGLRSGDGRNVEIAARIDRGPPPCGQSDAAGPLELVSSSVHAAMSFGRPAALRQSQSAHNSRLNRVRFHSGCAWVSPQIPSISEGLSYLPCMTMSLAMDAK
jgi:hypothetical protein